MTKKLLVLLSLVLFSLFFFLVKSEKAGTLGIQVKNDSYFEGLKIVNRKNGMQDWVLTAKRADLSKDGKEANLLDITMNIMDIKNEGLTISAGKALYDMRNKTVTIDSPITARTSNYTLTCGPARIDSDGGKMETETDVTIDSKRFHLQGKGMQADNNAQTVRIMKNVKAIFNL